MSKINYGFNFKLSRQSAIPDYGAFKVINVFNSLFFFLQGSVCDCAFD